MILPPFQIKKKKNSFSLFQIISKKDQLFIKHSPVTFVILGEQKQLSHNLF